MQNKALLGVGGLAVAVVVSACGAGHGSTGGKPAGGGSPGGGSSSYQDGFNFGKSTNWRGGDECELASAGVLVPTGDDRDAWEKGCHDGVKQAPSQ